MRNCFFIRILGCVVFAIISACGSSSSDEHKGTGAIVGNWAMGCSEFASGDVSERRTHDFQFKNSGSYSEKFQVFATEDGQCATPTEQRLVSGTYAVGELLEDAAELNLSLEKVTVTVYDAGTIDYLNGSGGGASAVVCGGNWTARKGKDLTEALCQGTNGDLPYAGMEIFDIYRVKKDALAFGLRSSGLPTESSNRPTKIDATVNLARK